MNDIVVLPLSEVAAEENALKLLIKAASTRIEMARFAEKPFSISVANADGTELAVYDSKKWTWTDAPMQPELNLSAFYVTFRAGRQITTVVVEAVR